MIPVIYYYEVIGETERLFEYFTREKHTQEDVDAAVRRAELRDKVCLRFVEKVVCP